MVTEAEAVATHYAASRMLASGDTVAVYDLGGAAFEATVLRVRADGVDILGAPEGFDLLGGDDFDDMVLSYAILSSGSSPAEMDLDDPVTTSALARLRQDCTLAKEALSFDTEVIIPVFMPDRHVDVRLTRAAFEDLIRRPIESTVDALTRTLRSAQVDPAMLRGVLLVGGSSRIPLVAQMISEALGCQVLTDTEPKYPVALGAAAAAAPRAAAAAIGPQQAPSTAARIRDTTTPAAAAAAANEPMDERRRPKLSSPDPIRPGFRPPDQRRGPAPRHWRLRWPRRARRPRRHDAVGTAGVAGWTPGRFDLVECAVYAPAGAAQGQTLVVQAFVYLAPDTAAVDELATGFDPSARRRAFTCLDLAVRYGQRLTFHLTMGGALVDAPVCHVRWTGTSVAAQFAVTIDPEFPHTAAIGKVAVCLDGVPVGHMVFTIAIGRRQNAVHLASSDAHAYRQVFVS